MLNGSYVYNTRSNLVQDSIITHAKRTNALEGMPQRFSKCVWIRHKLSTYSLFDVPPPPRINARKIFGIYFRVVPGLPMRFFHTVSCETQRMFFCESRSSASLLRCKSSWSSSASSMSVEASVAAGIRRFFASRGRKRFASCDKLTCIRCFGAIAIFPSVPKVYQCRQAVT